MSAGEPDEKLFAATVAIACQPNAAPCAVLAKAVELALEVQELANTAFNLAPVVWGAKVIVLAALTSSASTLS